jgi:hypothetical protein
MTAGRLAGGVALAGLLAFASAPALGESQATRHHQGVRAQVNFVVVIAPVLNFACAQPGAVVMPIAHPRPNASGPCSPAVTTVTNVVGAAAPSAAPSTASAIASVTLSWP